MTTTDPTANGQRLTETTVAAMQRAAENSPQTLTLALALVPKYAAQHSRAAEVEEIAASTVAACLPGILDSTDADARKHTAETAARTAVRRAAADVHRPSLDAPLSLDALAAAGIEPETDAPRFYRPATPQPEAPYRTTDDDLDAAALALAARLAPILLPDRSSDPLAERVEQSDTLPEPPAWLAPFLALVALIDPALPAALVAWLALTTDPDTGRPLALHQPPTVAGALALALGYRPEDRQARQVRQRIAETVEHVRLARALAVTDPYRDDRYSEPSHKTWTARTAAVAACQVERPGAVGPRAGETRPTVSPVVTEKDGRLTWTDAAGHQHNYPADAAGRYAAALALTQRIRPTGDRDAYADEETRQTQRIADALAAFQPGPVRKASGRKRATTGSTGPTIPARLPRD